MIAVLGASDPEMEAIESLLRASGVIVLYAAVDGVRVHPGNAYRADGLLGGEARVSDERARPALSLTRRGVGGYGYGGHTSVGTGDCYCDCDGCRMGDHHVEVRDMRRDTPIDELVEAATRDDVPYIAGPFVSPDGRRKFTVSGPSDVVSAWMAEWAPRNELRDIYGDPVRGFAGGYAP